MENASINEPESMEVEKGDNQMSKNWHLTLKNKLISKIRMRAKKGKLSDPGKMKLKALYQMSKMNNKTILIV